MRALAPAPSVLDGRKSATLAKLRYVTDEAPGIRREQRGRGVRYIGPTGSPVRNIGVLRRIKRLAIPPAWTDVWICADSHGHLQAVGRDARGRRQYRYHERWRQVRDEAKYGRMLAFGRALPGIRRCVARHLALPGLPREKVLATVVRLLERTRIRVGNEEYRKANRSFGLTTLRSGQVTVAGESLRLEFRGKGGKRHCVDVSDRRVAAIVRRCQDLPGHELFQYLGEDGRRHAIGSSDVNKYLQGLAGEEFTAKDFRTWAGTVLAARSLQPVERASRRAVNAAVKRVAEHLGNTPAICRKCYVHPAVIDAFLDGSLGRIAASIPRRASSAAGERMVMRLLGRVRRSSAAT
jgi:DNA topoisomerase I